MSVSDFSAARFDTLPDGARAPARALVAEIAAAAPPLVLGLTCFGAVALPGFEPRAAPLQSAIVLEAVDLDFLRRLAGSGQRLGRAGCRAPLVMTPNYIARSLDSFPLEFFEIRSSRRLVLGDDHFDVAIDDASLRTQCERELKALLVGMRQRLLASGGAAKLLSSGLDDALPTVLRVLRGMLHLHGRDGVLAGAAVLDALGAEAGVPLTALAQALAEDAHDWDVYRRCHDEIERLAGIVDAW